MEQIQRLRLQYVAAMAHQEVFQQQLNINQFIGGPHRWWRGARVRGIWRRLWQHPERKRQYGVYDQLMVELRKEDHRTFKIFIYMPTEMYEEILERVSHRIWKQHTWYRESLDPGLKIEAASYHALLPLMANIQPSWSLPALVPYIISIRVSLASSNWPLSTQTTSSCVVPWVFYYIYFKSFIASGNCQMRTYPFGNLRTPSQSCATVRMFAS